MAHTYHIYGTHTCVSHIWCHIQRVCMTLICQCHTCVAPHIRSHIWHTYMWMCHAYVTRITRLYGTHVSHIRRTCVTHMAHKYYTYATRTASLYATDGHSYRTPMAHIWHTYTHNESVCHTCVAYIAHMRHTYATHTTSLVRLSPVIE